MTANFPVEADYKAAWQRLPPASLAARAIEGGRLADRLAWVFCAAYQSAVRDCFSGLAADLWYCYAASEDRSGSLPGLTRTGDTLSGTKTWIAASSVVDKLIVTASGSLFVVDRHAAGITIDNGEPKSFLPELMQGVAHFSNTPYESETAMAGDFGFAEAFFMTCASAGYVSRWGTDSELNADMESLRSDVIRKDIQTLVDIHERIKQRGKAIAAAETTAVLKQDFDASGRLLGMYGRSLRQRLAST